MTNFSDIMTNYNNLFIESEFLFLDSYNCFLKSGHIPYLEWKDMNNEILYLIETLTRIENNVSYDISDHIFMEKIKMFNACSSIIYEFLSLFEMDKTNYF